MLLRALKAEVCRSTNFEVLVTVSPEVGTYIFNFKRQEISEIESKYRVSICIEIDGKMADRFDIQKRRVQKGANKIRLPLTHGVWLEGGEDYAEDGDDAQEPEVREDHRDSGNRNRNANTHDRKDTQSHSKKRQPRKRVKAVSAADEKGCSLLKGLWSKIID